MIPSCGTLNRWAVHRRRGESCEQCDPVCEKYLRLRREGIEIPDDLFAVPASRRTGATLKPATVGPAPCGTVNGAQGHKRRGEDPCRACKGATAVYLRLRKADLPVPPELRGEAEIRTAPPPANFRAVIEWLGDDIKIEELWERDGGICQLCRRRVPKPGTMSRSSRKPHAASPDHIVPMALKGPHVWSNMQLTHYLCNNSKNDGAFVETPLIKRALDALVGPSHVNGTLTWPAGSAGDPTDTEVTRDRPAAAVKQSDP